MGIAWHYCDICIYIHTYACSWLYTRVVNNENARKLYVFVNIGVAEVIEIMLIYPSQIAGLKMPKNQSSKDNWEDFMMIVYSRLVA